MREAIIFVIILFCSQFSNQCYAQQSKIVIFPSDSAEYSPKNIINKLLSQGVEIQDVRTNFDENISCMGYFVDPTQYMGMKQGMTLSTGVVTLVTGENKQENFTSSNVGVEELQVLLDSISKEGDTLSLETKMLLFNKSIQAGDADLSQEIKGLQTFDARVITIKFIPTADTFYYRYVFASEEYDEYVCSAFNDIFAFYIYQEEDKKINTALVPNQNIPVSINNINAGNPGKPNCKKRNAHLYHRNNGQYNLVYDGFTKVLDIRHKVKPGEVYYIKIAIADASDGALDSAVFIENNSIFTYFNSFEIFFNSDNFNPKNPFKIDEIVTELNKYPKNNVQLIGHTDIVGSKDYNYELSILRVQTIKEMLMLRGIPENRIIETYKGELMPRYPQNYKNRRVEAFILGE